MKPIEKKYGTTWRKELLTHAKGKVLEVGAGSGVNFPLYGTFVTEVVALDPNPYMMAKSLPRQSKAKVPITFINGKAENLPFSNQAFDSVVVTLVLCSVQDPAQTLSEIKRVLKPDGQVLFLEHIKMKNQPYSGLQDLITPVWKHLCDGCHLNRDTEKEIREAGFEIIQRQTYLSELVISLIGKLPKHTLSIN